MAKLKNKEEMFPLIKMYLNYKGRKKDFCAKHKISESTIGYWATKYRKIHLKPKEEENFVKIQPKHDTVEFQKSLFIQLPNGICIEGDIHKATSDFAFFIGKIYMETK